MAVVAVVNLLLAGEPALAFPHIALVLLVLQQSHPPVNAAQQGQSDHPLNRNEDQVYPAEENKPQTTVLAGHIGELHLCATTLGTLYIH